LSLALSILPAHPRKEQAVEESNRLEEVLAELAPESRRVIEVWLEGLSHSEAAEMLGLSERAFAVVRMNAIERLRQLLGQETAAWETN
jgi:RNA polymerase sigma factor (sigma-70 family)